MAGPSYLRTLISRSWLCVYNCAIHNTKSMTNFHTRNHRPPKGQRTPYHAQLYQWYRSLIPMSWNYKRPLRLHIRISQETRQQMNDIRAFMAEAEPSDADAVAWAVSLLHRHISHHVKPSQSTFMPQEIPFQSLTL